MNTIFQKGGKPFFVLGRQAHNTSTYQDSELEICWKALDALGANTAEIPIYWEAIEPEEGRFDFTQLEKVVAQARAHGKMLILLWFGTWKNGCMRYTPAWVKKDTARFARVINHDGQKLFVLSSHCEENRLADQRAFLAVMGRLAQIDAVEHTVIAVQVENEAGIGGRAYRDFGEQAQREYQSEVSRELIEYIEKLGQGPVFENWQRQGARRKGSYAQLFGVKRGSEYLTAISVARYIDRICEAAAQVYDIPYYVNVALDRQHYGWDLAGTNYTGGGPVTKLYDLWKFYTPHVALLAPDIYFGSTRDFERVCGVYARADNPLFVPESANGADGTNFKNMFYALGDYNAIGYAAFGIEDIVHPDGAVKENCRALADSFRSVSAALPLLARYHKTGRIHTVVQEEGDSGRLFEFPRYLVHVVFEQTRGNFLYRNEAYPPQRGRGLIIEGEGDDEFFILGTGFISYFTHQSDIFYDEDIVSNHMSYLSVEEGHFDPDGVFKTDRIRTGDEVDYGMWISAKNGVLRVRLCE